MSAEYRITTPAPTLDTADDRARPLLQDAQAKLGFVPNMYRSMAKLPAVLDVYNHGYERFREESGLAPAEQEVVLLTISRENGCGYCMAAHSMLADKVSGVPAEVTAALRDDRPIPDERLAALGDFTRIMFRTRGRPSRVEAERFLAAGFEERHILAIVLALAVKTLSNYSNHSNQPELDDAFAGHAWSG